MTPSFLVHTTPHFDRLLHRLSRWHPELVGRYAEAMAILAADPYNYDVFGREIWLFHCGLRREDTY